MRAFGHLNAWLEATKCRLEITESVLGQFKPVSLANFVQDLVSRVSALRETEIQISKAYRSMLVGVIATGTWYGISKGNRAD